MLLISLTYCLISGVLLALASPSLGIWQLSFVAFIPLLFSIEKQSQRKSCTLSHLLFMGFIFSFIFTVSCFYWIANMNMAAMFAVSTIYALVYSLFVPGVALGLKAGLNKPLLSLWTICLWVSLEVILSDVLLPLPSLAIGYTLWPLQFAIQCADLTGVFGTSFWILTINILIYNICQDRFNINRPFLIITLLFICLPIGYGFVKAPAPLNDHHNTISIINVYTSILTEEKENPITKRRIFEILQQQTSQAISKSTSPPDLVIWPETSVPVFLRSIHEKEFVQGLLKTARQTKVPILMGALSFQRDKDLTIQKFNAAFLIPVQSFISQEYHKNILVPFVETNPLNELLPDNNSWLRGGKYKAGEKPGIIHLDKQRTFGVIICYEALFPDFVRKAANKGSGFLVNITNDHHAFRNLTPAYKIPISHLVFRAIENKKHIIRSANWGFSMVISPQGKILQSSPVGTSGYLSTAITANNNETFFSKHGFLFARILLLLTLAWTLLLLQKVFFIHKL